MRGLQQSQRWRVFLLLFGILLGWGLYRFGGTEIQTGYRLFLLGGLLTLAATFLVPVSGSTRRRALLLLPVGMGLLLAILWNGTLPGRGFVHLTLGWMSLFLALILTGSGWRACRFLFLLLVVLGAGEAVCGLVQAVGGVGPIGDYPSGNEGLATGTLINRNHFAALLNLSIPLALGAGFAGFTGDAPRLGERWEAYARTWGLLLCLSFMGLVILLSLSRSGTVFLVFTLLFLAALLRLNRKRRGKGQLSAVAGGILLLTILGLGAWTGSGALGERFQTTASGLAGRTEVYQATLELIAENPLGVGPGMFQWRFRPFQPSDAVVLVHHTHNDYLQTAAEWGVGGALLFWSLVFWALLRSIRTFLSSNHPWRKGMALGCSGAFFSMLLHSGVDFSLQIPALWMIFMALMGLAWNLGERGRRALPAPGQ